MRRFILGTDWWTDCDDAVALRILARAHKAGNIDLLGVGINACMEHSVASLEGFLQLEGVDGMPIGIDRDATDFSGRPPYQARLARHARRCPDNRCAEDAVTLYRRLLAASDAPVEMIEIGYLQVFAGLLTSPPDAFSPLAGIDLVREKVNRVWIMAGKWDEPVGRENNFCRSSRACHAGETVCRLCPVPVTFLGYEVGFGVLSGGDLPAEDPLHLALCDHGSANGRHSWDPMLVTAALIGDESAAGYGVVRGTARVNAEDGTNTFLPDENGLHRYLVKQRENSWYERQLSLLIH